MTQVTFDALEYARELEAVGFTREQAEAQARLTRQQAENQAAALQRVLDKYDETQRRELATKGDVQDVRLEIENVRAALRETELRLQKEIEKARGEVEKAKYDLLKWQIGGWIALAAIMAKGFNWLGF